MLIQRQTIFAMALEIRMQRDIEIFNTRIRKIFILKLLRNYVVIIDSFSILNALKNSFYLLICHRAFAL